MRYFVHRITILILFYLPFSAFAHEGPSHYGPHMMWQGYGMMMGPFIMVLFIAAIIVVGALTFRWLGNHGLGPRTSSSENPVETLKLRLARGEIDKDEYEERLKLLQTEI